MNGNDERFQSGDVVASQKISNFRLKNDASAPILHQPARLLVDVNFAAERPQSDRIEQPAERPADHDHFQSRGVPI